MTKKKETPTLAIAVTLAVVLMCTLIVVKWQSPRKETKITNMNVGMPKPTQQVAMTYPTPKPAIVDTDLTVKFPLLPTLPWKPVAAGKEDLNRLSFGGRSDVGPEDSVYLGGKKWEIQVVLTTKDDSGWKIVDQLNQAQLLKSFLKLRDKGWDNTNTYLGDYTLYPPGASGVRGQVIGFMKSYELDRKSYYKMVSYSERNESKIHNDPTGKEPYIQDYPITYTFDLFEGEIMTGEYLMSILK